MSLRKEKKVRINGPFICPEKPVRGPILSRIWQDLKDTKEQILCRKDLALWLLNRVNDEIKEGRKFVTVYYGKRWDFQGVPVREYNPYNYTPLRKLTTRTGALIKGFFNCIPDDYRIFNHRAQNG